MKKKKILTSFFSGIISSVLAMTLIIPYGNMSKLNAAETYTVVFPVKNGMKIAYYQGTTSEYGGYHRGIDIHSSGDDTIYCGMDAKVTAVVNSCPHISAARYSDAGHCNCGTGNATYGNYVFATDASGIKYIYAHMVQNSIKVKVGDNIKAGQALGTMGSSGWASGKHLHFEMNKGSTVINTNPTKDTGTYKYYGNVKYITGINGMIVSGETKPTGQLKEGHYFELKGVITSGKPITKVWGGVYVRGGLATSEYCEAKPNTTSYDLHGKFNDEIIFDNLKVGYYTYKIEASDSDGKNYTLITSDFQIGSPSYTSKSVKVTFYRNLDSDDQHSVNEIFTNGVANQRFGYTPDGKGRYRTMNDADKGFGEWVKEGYNFLGWSEDKNASEANYKTYSGVKDSWIESKSPEISLYAVWSPAESSEPVSGMTVSGETKPTGQLKEGRFFELKGVITSGKPITRVWGGVYVRGGSSTSEYCEARPNTTSYDLHNQFNDEIIFDNLKAGEYTYRIEASDSDGNIYTLIESDFEIAGSGENISHPFVKGIDVSAFQNTINWSQVASDDVKFAIVRSASTHIDTADYKQDSKFEENYSGAKAAGLKVGTYIYTSANSETEMKSNINSLLETLDGKSLDMPVYLDLETADRQKKLGKTEFTKVIVYGCRMIKDAGYNPGVYATADWFKNYIDKQTLIDNGIEIWMAAWPSASTAVNPAGYDYSSACTVWQYASTGKISGISSNVDLDVRYGEFNSSPSDPPADISETIMGDINESGIVDMTDLSYLSLYLLGDYELKTENQIKAADINHDGNIDIADLPRLKQFISKIIDKI